MAKKKRKYYSGKELLYRRQLDGAGRSGRKDKQHKGAPATQINASSRAIGWAKQKMREGKNNDCISD